jgi:hypothetical protein
MLIRSMLSHVAACAVAAASLTLLSTSSAPASTATVSPSPSQTIKGWGCFVSYDNSAGDGSGQIWTRPAIQDALYNSGVTIMRTGLDPQLYVSGGSTIGNVVLNQTKLTDKVHQVQIAVNHGVNLWTMHTWSPPASMKCSGTTLAGHLNTGSEQTYCNYYAAVLIAVHNQGLPYPFYISIENEPVTEGTFCGTTGSWDHSNFMDVAQYIRVVKMMRATLDVNGMSAVKIFGPESSEYYPNTRNDNWLGGSTFANLNDSAFNNALAAYAWHSYTTHEAADCASGIAAHPKDAFQTEYSIPEGTTEMDWTMNATRHMAGDLVDVPNNYWYWWRGWLFLYGGGNPGNEDLLAGDTSPVYSKRYFVFQKLWSTVRPGWIVKKMTTDDANLKVSGAYSDSHVKVDLMAFENVGGTKTAVLACNWTGGAKSVTFNGLKGASYTLFTTDGTRDMAVSGTGTITGGAATISLPTFSVNLIVTDPTPGNATIINCGGAAASGFTDDTNYAGGTTAFTAWNVNTTGVTNPAPNEVYETERYGNMTYTVQGLTPGASYKVRMHFCENYWTAAGQRTFNVSLNSVQVLSAFDVRATAGAQHKAVVREFTQNADAAGKFTIVFTSLVNNALINGIEVLPVGSGNSIGINFVGNGTTMGSSETAGVIPVTNWNNANGASQSIGQALVDNTGTATGATATWSSTNTWVLPITDAAGSVRMMRGYLDTSNTSTTTITVSGIPALFTSTAYDVIVYTDHDNAVATRTGNYTIGGTTLTSTDNANANFAGAFAEGLQYVRFNGLTGSSFVLSATPNTSTDGNKRAPVNGIQIVTHRIAVNAGGPNASPYIADTGFSGGSTATNWTGAIDTSAAAIPAPQAVYQSERYGSPAMSYTLGGFAANSPHTVRLHFCENYFTASGARKFHVAINGTTVLTNFDIFATAGAAHKANIQQFTANANASGQYVVSFTNVTNNALVNGIEVK